MSITKEKEVSCPKIEYTKDYEVFKTMEGNRQISEIHVKNLISFIKNKNLLRVNPILVNEKFEVVDGQHRLEAAKELGIPIFYILEEGLSYLDAGILNACNDDFEFKEYLDLYLKNGVHEYIKLDRFKTKHNLSFKRFQYLMSSEQKEVFDRTFKIGAFKIIDDLEDISDKINKINDIIGYLENILVNDNKRFLYTDNFWRALYKFLITKDVDADKFKEKLGVKHQSVTPKSGYKDYVKLFTDIYNWKTKKRIA
jgi:hypothetical protein